MTHDREPHRCWSGSGCVNPDVRTKDEQGHSIPRGALVVEEGLCDGCTTRLERSVKFMAKDWLRLRAHLGVKASGDGDRVGGTREAAIPLNVQVEALMSRLVELAERATAMVGKPVDRLNRRSAQRDGQVIATAVRYLLPRLKQLVLAPPTDTVVWSKIPTADTQWDEKLGHPRERTKLSGMEIAHEIVQANRLVGRLLGKDRLRHHYALPCPAYDSKTGRYCGAMTVGRDDGQARFDCLTCGAHWSQTEYELLTTLVLDEIKVKEENQVLRWLLAEANWRLDTLQLRSDALDDGWDDLMSMLVNNPGQAPDTVSMIREALAGVLTAGEHPHQRPADRTAAAAEVVA